MRNWRIHIGAHKTATTHIQYTLDALAAAMRERGVQHVPTAHLRSERFPRRAIRPSGWLPCLSHRLMHQRTAALLGEDQSFESLVLSEENILGQITSCFGNQFYPDAERRLRFLNSSTGFRSVTIFVSMRRQDAIAASAYSQVLRVRPLEGPFRGLAAEMLRNPPSWCDLIYRIRTALPRAEVKAWAFERYVERSRPFIEALTGCSFDSIPAIERPTRTQSLPAEAIARIETLDRGMSEEQYRRAVDAVISDVPEGSRFDPFTGEDKRRFAEIYRADIEAILREHPGVLLEADRPVQAASG